METPEEENGSIYTATLSHQSMNAIAETYVGQSLSDKTLKVFGEIIRDNINKLMEEAVKCCKRTSATTLTVAHLQQAQRELGFNDSTMLHIDVDWDKINVRQQDQKLKAKRRQPAIEPAAKSLPILTLPEPVVLKSDWTRWETEEQVLMMRNRRYPLSREQQLYYVQTTDKLVGDCEQDRLDTLEIVTIDPSLHFMLPQLANFISQGITLNIQQKNSVMLSHLLRTVDKLLRNENIFIKPFLHLIVPAVVSCTVANRICDFPSSIDHWAMREFAASITANIVRHFDSDQEYIKQKVLKIYTEGLEKSSLTSVYGCIIGISKLGDFEFLKHVVPHIAAISDRIEPFLIDKTIGYTNKIASTFIKHRLMMECGRIFKYQFDDDDEKGDDDDNDGIDELEYYKKNYNYMGTPLYHAVMLNRDLDVAHDAVLVEELEKLAIAK